jgi:CRP/FNR family transcriptional regulator, anaerobic regulatory protein
MASLILLRASSDGCLRMTQQEMAYHLGTTREVVARIMGEFVAKQLVETRRELTIIRNSSGLSALLAAGFEIEACEKPAFPSN